MEKSKKIPEGYKDSPVGVIPSEWDVKRLGELINIFSGDSPSLYNLSTQGKYPYLKVEDLNNTDKYQSLSREYSNQVNNNIIPKNSIIFPKRGAAILNNKVRINLVPVLMDSNLMAIYPRTDELEYNFLFYKIIFEKLSKIADTSTIPQLNNKHLIPYIISIPPILEQKKITDILSVSDEAIEKQSLLIDKLKLRKHALMQQLLTGKKRLKGYNKNWNYYKLREIFEKVESVNDGNNHHLIMTISAKTGFISQNDKFDRVIAGESLNRYTLIKKGDFAYNKGNSKLYEMGCIFQYDHSDSALVPFVYICFRPTSKVDASFYKQWFINHGLDRQLKKIITSGARGDGLLNVNKEDFFSLSVPYPPLEEQTAIANILSAADKEIEIATLKLNKLKEQKKGMMQQLLTGKKRVKIN